MNPQDEIEQLEARKRELLGAQARCNHTFTEAKRSFKEVKEPRYENQPRGSDFFNPVLVGYDPKQVPIWVRHCTKCGLKQETEKADEVVVKTETRPRF